MTHREDFSPDTIKAGAVSGFATGVFSIPEGMAYASLAGVNPVYGLYSGLVGTLVAALTTGTVLMISTLTSAIALSTGSVLSVAGITSEDMPRAVFTVTLLTGALMLGLGLARLGSLVSFVSNAVMTGFVAAAALLIIVGELGDFSGYEPDGSNKLTELWDWLRHVNDWDPTTTTVSIATIVLVLVGKRFRATEKLAPVIVLLAMTVAATVLELSVATVGDIASIPRALPGPVLPDISLVPHLAVGSISVAVVALVQGAGISTAYPNPDGSTASPSRDFVGQGAGNIVGSCFQSMPTGGSLSRTGISVSGGARSRWGGVFAVVWLGGLVLLFGSAAERVPLSVIAGLLFVLAGELIIGRVANAEFAVHSSWSSTAAMALTFGAALFIPLQWTIFLGAGLSLLTYIAMSFRAGSVRGLAPTDDGLWRETAPPTTLTSHTVTVVNLRDWKFYADVPRLAQQLPQPAAANGAVVVVRMRDVTQIRSTGLRVLEHYRETLAAGGNVLVLEGVQPDVYDTIARSGIAERLGEDNIFRAGDEFTASLSAAYEHAQRLIHSD
jgi:SulP family sulfate permease